MIDLSISCLTFAAFSELNIVGSQLETNKKAMSIQVLSLHHLPFFLFLKLFACLSWIMSFALGLVISALILNIL